MYLKKGWRLEISKDKSIYDLVLKFIGELECPVCQNTKKIEEKIIFGFLGRTDLLHKLEKKDCPNCGVISNLPQNDFRELYNKIDTHVCNFFEEILNSE